MRKISEEVFRAFISELKERVECAQEAYANLDWLSKEQALGIIDELVKKLG